jgi:uncharacterized protein YndB with AHSA1/START domain
MTETVQINRVYIKASPEAIWDAITKPEWTRKYGYGGNANYDLRAGGSFRVDADEEYKKASAAAGFEVPDVLLDGEVLEADPPRKLVQTWRLVMDPGLAEEGFTRLTYEIVPLDNGVTKLTVIHDVSGAPGTAQLTSGDLESTGAGGGWVWVLSELKTLLETGATFKEPAA